jgi:dienelactone hydrolase
MRTLVLSSCVLASIAAHADPDVSELKHRNAALVAEGFNLTQVLPSFAAATKIELIAPGSEDETTISLWFETEHGQLTVRLLDPRGDVVTSKRGHTVELRVRRVVSSGKYTVEVTPDVDGRGVIGVKGAMIGTCPLDGRVTEHAAEPGRGFSWPYLLAIPQHATAHALLVLPNNSGFATDDRDVLRAAATCQLAQQLDLAERLGTPVVMPMFPRPPTGNTNLYLHALSRESLEAKPAALARVDVQLLAMIDHARALLAAQGHEVGPRVLISGFSAAGMFANRFAVLHPDRTLAAAVGSPGGWPLAPVTTEGRDSLPYPVGVSDVARLIGNRIDVAALRKVRLFFFLGEEDRNDSVIYRDSFSAADETLITRLFGATPVARWPVAQRLYERAKLDATFKLYPGVAHTVTSEMQRDIEAALSSALAH